MAMASKIFILGSTGYIGGDSLYAIVQKHPEFEISCLVRNSDKGAQIASQYSRVRLVYGGLDSFDILEEEARKADIVIQSASADHEEATKALIRGLEGHPDNQPGYLIHTSGTGVLLFADVERKIFGEASSKIYDDWDGIRETTSLPEFAPHRAVDKLVLAAGTENESKIKTAIVCPPTIYGRGRGPGNQRGHQIYELSRCILEKKIGIQVGAGKTYWPNIHVFDLSDCYVKLVEAAVDRGSSATWGKEGYYFTENGEHVWGEVSKLIASAAQKQRLIPSNDVITVSAEEADKLTPHGSALWGANSRCKAIRARKVLAWSPEQQSLVSEIPEAVKSEASRLGLLPGHASQVAD